MRAECAFKGESGSRSEDPSGLSCTTLRGDGKRREGEEVVEDHMHTPLLVKVPVGCSI